MVTLPGLLVNQTSLSVTSIQLVPNMDFPTVCEDKTDCAGSVAVQSVTLAGLSVIVPDRPVKFQGQSVTLTNWVLESGKFITDKP